MIDDILYKIKEKENIKKYGIRVINVFQYRFYDIKLLDEIHTTFFDIHGNEVLASSYIENGKRLFTTIYVYNNQDVQVSELHIDELGQLDSEMFERNDDCKIHKVLIYNINRDLERKEVFIYDDMQNLINIFGYSAEDILVSKVLHKYDKSNKLIETKAYEFDEISSYNTIYEYDPHGFLKVIKFKKSNDELESEIHYKYDSGGKVSESIELNAKNKIEEKAIYTYNEKGLLKSKIEYNGVEDIKFIFECKYEYFDDIAKEKLGYQT